MADSDDDYVQDPSGDEGVGQHVVKAGSRGTRSRPRGAGKEAAWEVTRTWEGVTEDADGTITGTVEGLLEAGKRKRFSFSPGFYVLAQH